MPRSIKCWVMDVLKPNAWMVSNAFAIFAANSDEEFGSALEILSFLDFGNSRMVRLM